MAPLETRLSNDFDVATWIGDFGQLFVARIQGITSMRECDLLDG